MAASIEHVFSGDGPLSRAVSAYRARPGQVELASAMMGEMSVEQLSDRILAFLARYAGAQAGALFKGDFAGFRRTATVGVPADVAIPERFGIKDGLLGQAAAEGRPVVVVDWKSDVAPDPQTLDHYRGQVRAYLDMTGAEQGLIVLMTSATVISVSPSLQTMAA